MAAGNLPLSTDLTFTTANMTLTPLDTLTSAWGSAMAANTGFLAMRPRTLLSFTMGAASPSGTNIVGEGYVYLSRGSYMIYYSFQNPLDHKYMPYKLYFISDGLLTGTDDTFAEGERSGVYQLIGTTTQGAAGGHLSETGSTLVVFDSDGYINWILQAVHTDSFCSMILQSVHYAKEVL